uniref:Candidate secreted effector n=1 Tax=Meloidogyne incognita TaxID=6306 RepID=A0A914NT53_MELIC
MLFSINLIVLLFIFFYYISNVTPVDKSLESTASFGNWVDGKTDDEQTSIIADVGSSNVDSNVDQVERPFTFSVPTTEEVSDHAVRKLINI